MPTTNSPATLTVRPVFEQLEDRGLLTAEQKEKAAVVLAPRHMEVNQGIKVLTVAGAWIAAVAFTAFVMNLVQPKGAGGIVIGLGYCVGATFLRRMARHDFFVQAALAFVFAGYGIALVSVHESFGYSAHTEREWATSATAVVMAAILYFMYDYPLQRLVVPFVALMILFGTITEDRCWIGLHLLLLVEVLGVLYLFAQRTDLPALRPPGFALAVALAVTVWPMSGPIHNHDFWRTSTSDTPAAWPSQVTLALALVWLVIWAARRALPEGTDAAACLKRVPVLVALGTIVVFAVVANPALLAGILLLILGQATRERVLALAGLLVFLGGLTVVFCDYDFSLTARSGLLVASGMVLLAARFVLWRLTAADATPEKGAA